MSQGGCVEILESGERCGWNQHPAGLHWDHVGTKEHHYREAFSPSWAWDRILAEIAKCDLVCACCHAIRTATRGYGGGTPTHGVKRPRVVPGEFGRRAPTSTARIGTRLAACHKGHDFTPENTINRRDGSRCCRACHNANKRERRRLGLR